MRGTRSHRIQETYKGKIRLDRGSAPPPAQRPGSWRTPWPWPWNTLHEWLALQAHREGVSLNTFVLGCLAEAKGRSEEAREMAGRST